jgi:protein-S-isoprenylcysteine O-methyltransferase Ste14
MRIDEFGAPRTATDMDDTVEFRVAIGILIAAALVVRIPRHVRSYESGEKQLLESKLNIAARSLAGLAGFALLIVYLVEPEWIGWAQLPMPNWMRWLGAVIGIAGIGGLIWVHRELGRNFSGTLQVRADQTLITSGPYRWVRHPMYTMMYLITISFFLLSANWGLGVIWIGGFTLVVISRLSKEDAAMEATFGDEYRTWASRTGRLLPR